MNTGVVIVTYNRLELLKECIQCVLSQTVPFSKIVIVDNCSTDGTKEYLAGYENDERFDIVYEPENLGGSGGFYEAIREVNEYTLDWVLIIDDDAMISKDYIEILTDFAEKHPEVNACSGVVSTKGTIVAMHRRRVGNSLLFLETNVPLEEYKKEYFKCDLGTFCGLLVRHDILKKAGLPKKEYFIWYDDTEYCLRLRQYGGIYNVNAAVLNHKTALPMDEKNIFVKTNWKSYYGYRNRYDTAKTHFSWLTALIVRLQFIVLIGYSRLMTLKKSTREKGRFNVRMFKAALRDGAKGRLGKNPEFLP